LRTRQALTTTIGLTAALGMLGLWMAASAAAHVTVAAPGVTAGASDASITFHVPTEGDTANTVGLKLQLPTDHPIAGVLVAPQTGWTATITQTKLTTPIHTDDGNITQVVSEIDWKALPGAGIKPGFFGEFSIIAGKLPDGVTALTFKAIQIYSDGTQVAWIEQPAPGSGAEPEHPAPNIEAAGRVRDRNRRGRRNPHLNKQRNNYQQPGKQRRGHNRNRARHHRHRPRNHGAAARPPQGAPTSPVRTASPLDLRGREWARPH
jgi:uncharacterized protein YcnI